MNNSSYIFYLTELRKVAALICDGLSSRQKRDSFHSIGYNAVNEDMRIPAIYHGCGYFYAFAETLTPIGEVPKYELKFC